MPEPGLNTRYRAVLTVALLAQLLAGCAAFEDWLRGRQTAEASEDVAAGTSDSLGYLEELRRLVRGDPPTQVEIHADAESAATLTPNPSTKLRYALVLATPGHTGSDAEKAASLLRELLTQTELMTAPEIALATIYLDNVDQQLVLAAENRRLHSANASAALAEQEAIARRIAEVEAENETLRRQLADVEQKLEALTLIERSIRDRADETGS